MTWVRGAAAFTETKTARTPDATGSDAASSVVAMEAPDRPPGEVREIECRVVVAVEMAGPPGLPLTDAALGRRRPLLGTASAAGPCPLGLALGVGQAAPDGRPTAPAAHRTDAETSPMVDGRRPPVAPAEGVTTALGPV